MNGKNFLLSIDTKKIKYGLLRTKQLLEACNNPQKKIKSIQIIGTNGKGTIAAMLNNVLINNGYKTGLFTSPHLVSFNERISINYKKIPESFINSFIKKYKKSIEFIKPSFFEIMTVMGIYYFQQKRVDFAILETGLGGRLDSVTAANAEVAIFTSISYDHTQILGKQLSDIAYELSLVDGVASVVPPLGSDTVIKIENKYKLEDGYSGNFYDIDSGLIDGVLYPALDPSIFEIKYPNSDIKGKVIGDNLGITE